MRSKRFALAVAALATAVLASEGRAQSIAYINLLQFDLHSFRSQATAGIFYDDVDRIADATRLLEIDGTRIYTNFSNLADPATLGDNLITYSVDRYADFAANADRPGSYSGAPDTFDSGSYLGGWVGKYAKDSDYVFEVIYQRSGDKAMFEDLEDGTLGTNIGSSTDAEYTATITTAYDDGTGGDTAGDGDVDRTSVQSSDLTRFDDRSATRFDLGAAREIPNTDWSIGGRIFWRSDKIERNAEGTTEVTNYQKFVADGDLVETGGTTWEYSGSMEDAFKMREAGVSLNADWHPGGWSLNTRLDIAGVNMTNPSVGPSGFDRGYSSDTPWFMSGLSPDLYRQTNRTVVTTDAGDLPNDPALGSLDVDHVNTQFATGPFYLGDYRDWYGLARGIPWAVESVDDERTGIGFGAKLELDRPAWGGDTRSWVGLNYRPVDIDATIVLSSMQGQTFWWNDGVNGDQQATLINYDESLNVDWNGDASNTVLEAGSKWWKQLSNRVGMGLGLVVTRATWSQEYRETDSWVRVENSFDDGFGTLGGNELDTFAGGTGAYNEQMLMFEETYIYDVNDEHRMTTLRLPVGAQFNITKKLKWQMGVQHQIDYYTRETSRAVPVDGTGQTVETFTDYNTPANDYVIYGSSGQTSGNDNVTDKDEYNKTTYWYGIEWLVGETAQFNINGFFDTYAGDDNPDPMFDYDNNNDIWDVEFFKNLAVSLTFKFD